MNNRFFALLLTLFVGGNVCGMEGESLESQIKKAQSKLDFYEKILKESPNNKEEIEQLAKEAPENCLEGLYTILNRRYIFLPTLTQKRIEESNNTLRRLKESLNQEEQYKDVNDDYSSIINNSNTIYNVQNAKESSGELTDDDLESNAMIKVESPQERDRVRQTFENIHQSDQNYQNENHEDLTTEEPLILDLKSVNQKLVSMKEDSELSPLSNRSTSKDEDEGVQEALSNSSPMYHFDQNSHNRNEVDHSGQNAPEDDFLPLDSDCDNSADTIIIKSDDENSNKLIINEQLKIRRIRIGSTNPLDESDSEFERDPSFCFDQINSDQNQNEANLPKKDQFKFGRFSMETGFGLLGIAGLAIGTYKIHGYLSQRIERAQNEGILNSLCLRIIGVEEEGHPSTKGKAESPLEYFDAHAAQLTLINAEDKALLRAGIEHQDIDGTPDLIEDLRRSIDDSINTQYRKKGALGLIKAGIIKDFNAFKTWTLGLFGLNKNK